MSDSRAAVDSLFEELYRGHRADVYRAALRELGNVHDAEDVTQAAFVDAYRAVLRGTKPQSPRAWLLAISENVRRRRSRTSQRRPREEQLDADFPLAAELPYEQTRVLAEALLGLPAEQRRVFVLRELAGLSYDEIAEHVGSTVASIQMLLFRARRSLRAELEPPTVASRRTGLLVPVPGWLTGLLSRVEVAALTPRAAGAVGATVIAVAGTSVAVTDAQADGQDAPRAAVEPRPALVSRPAVDRPTAAFTSARAKTAARSASTVRPQRQTPEPRKPKEVAAPPAWIAPVAAPAPVPAPASAPAAAPARTTPQTIRAPERPRLPVPLPEEKVRGVLEPPVPPVVEGPRLPVPLPDEKVRSPLEPPVPPPLSTAPVLGAAAGAASVAGDDAPPLPVPALPPPTLPPVP